LVDNLTYLKSKLGQNFTKLLLKTIIAFYMNTAALYIKRLERSKFKYHEACDFFARLFSQSLKILNRIV